jgi:hypothetical protein
MVVGDVRHALDLAMSSLFGDTPPEAVEDPEDRRFALPTWMRTR